MNSLLTLGTFAFEGLEAPEQIHLKTRQRLALHHLGSGHSTLDYLGDDYETVSFRGIFYGTNAADRIRALDRLRAQGRPLSLAWNARTLTVIVRELDLDYSSSRWIPYRLSCYVVQSGTQDTADALSITPIVQVSDVLGWLQNTGVTLTSAQTAAIVSLATLNYDTPPVGALGQAQDLANQIATQLTTLISTAQSGPIGCASDLLAYVLNAGQQAALILGRNRVVNVMVNAKGVNRP